MGFVGKHLLLHHGAVDKNKTEASVPNNMLYVDIKNVFMYFPTYRIKVIDMSGIYEIHIYIYTP